MTIKEIFTREVAEKAANTLNRLFANDKEPTYSLGFQRWQKLSLSQKKALMLKNNFNYQDCINELQYI